MPHMAEMGACSLGLEIKKILPDLPVILMGHNMKTISQLSENRDCSGIDKTFIWTGNSDLLLAIVKNTEDHINAAHDTKCAMVRVLILVEDSPVYRSSFLPLIYKEIVRQIQSLLELGLNEEHRLLLMRARPKILLAENYEKAMALYKKFQPYLFGIISDARFPRKGVLDEKAGIDFLSHIRKDIFDIPLLLLSSDSDNRRKAESIPAIFIDKNSQNLRGELHDFFLNHLGFGDFIFRMPDGTEIDRCHNLKSLIEKLPNIPDESLYYHSDRNHFPF
jgi:CheY-like chemotaxis protein